MSEDEWLRSTEPTTMLQFLKGRASSRKLRLFACACCRRIWDLLPDQRSRNAVLAAEQFADGVLDFKDFRRFRYEALEVADKVWRSPAPGQPAQPNTLAAANVAQANAYLAAFTVSFDASIDRETSVCRYQELSAQANLLRDIFGPLPFRSLDLPFSLNKEKLSSLAQGMYERQQFDGMWQIADELAKQGYDNNDILEHCKTRSEHVRGCWVIDLLLGKE